MGSKRKMVQEFHECMLQPIGVDINNSAEHMQLLQFRMSLIREEYTELSEAIDKMWTTVQKSNNKQAYVEQRANVIKELMDLIYVIEGFCVTYGYDSEEAFARVHESNMSKLVGGEPYKDAAGKVMKNPDYVPPNMEGLCDLK